MRWGIYKITMAGDGLEILYEASGEGIVKWNKNY